MRVQLVVVIFVESNQRMRAERLDNRRSRVQWNGSRSHMVFARGMNLPRSPMRVRGRHFRPT